MNAWLAAQIVFAVGSWLFAGRWIARYYAFAAATGRGLAGTIRELMHAGRAEDLPRLAEVLALPVLDDLLDAAPGSRSAEQLISSAQTVAALMAPPVRLLRAMATSGTMLGLLAAVATLRTGLDAQTAGLMQGAAARAFDSAVLGFVTALPCWSAIALLGQRSRALLSELDLVVLAIGSPRHPSEHPAAGSDPSNAEVPPSEKPST